MERVFIFDKFLFSCRNYWFTFMKYLLLIIIILMSFFSGVIITDMIMIMPQDTNCWYSNHVIQPKKCINNPNNFEPTCPSEY